MAVVTEALNGEEVGDVGIILRRWNELVAEPERLSDLAAVQGMVGDGE